MTDLITDAENKLDSLIAAEEGNDPNPGDGGEQPPEDGSQPPAGDDEELNNGEGDGNGDDGQGGDGGEEEEQPSEGEEEEPGEGEEPNPDAGKPKGDETSKPLSDDELIAELEKRGLKVAKKDEEKQEQPKAPEFKRPDELPDRIWDQMKPVQRYIYTELPYITIVGTQGEGEDAKQVELQVKTPDQIPDDFNFASKRAEKIADDAFLEQNKRADQMYSRIQYTATQSQEQARQQQESQMIISGVETLQKDGIIPKITAEPGTPEFDKDPGVLRANEIIAYREDLLRQGERVSMVAAGKMFKADHPELYAPKPAPKGDAERARASKIVSGGGRGTPASAKKNDRPAFPPGTSCSDIADFHSQDLD